jgi:hypothetical protein
MTTDSSEAPDEQHHDQDAEPASTPTGAAAAGGPEEEDQDAEPASAPDPA